MNGVWISIAHVNLSENPLEPSPLLSELWEDYLTCKHSELHTLCLVVIFTSTKMKAENIECMQSVKEEEEDVLC